MQSDTIEHTMSSQLKSFLSTLIGSHTTTVEQRRRGRLLARVIVISAVFNLVMTLANLRLWITEETRLDGTYFFMGLVGLGLLAVVWLVNKRGYTQLAAALTLTLYYGRICLVHDPERFSYSFWAFLLPIFIAGFVIKPRATFAAATLSISIYLLVSVNVGYTEPLDIRIFNLCILVVLAMLTYFVASHLDWAIASINKSETRFRELFNNVPIGLYRTTPEGDILDANAAFLEMFAAPSLEALQCIKAADLYASPGSRAIYLESIEAKHPAELQMRRSDGVTFWVTDHVQPIRDAAGKILFYEGSLIDVSERKKAEQKLEHLAITDPLTGIANRRQFFVQAERFISQVRKPSFKVAALMIDIDHFKATNDNFGHAAGDIVLHDAAQRIRANLRTSDICGRYGGEEFSALLSEVSEQEILQVADRLCKSIAAAPFRVGDAEIKVTISLGISLMDSPATSLDTLLQRADQALYAAKQAGRNQWKLWSRAMNVRL